MNNIENSTAKTKPPNPSSPKSNLSTKIKSKFLPKKLNQYQNKLTKQKQIQEQHAKNYDSLKSEFSKVENLNTQLKQDFIDLQSEYITKESEKEKLANAQLLKIELLKSQLAKLEEEKDRLENEELTGKKFPARSRKSSAPNSPTKSHSNPHKVNLNNTKLTAIEKALYDIKDQISECAEIYAKKEEEKSRERIHSQNSPAPGNSGFRSSSNSKKQVMENLDLETSKLTNQLNLSSDINSLFFEEIEDSYQKNKKLKQAHISQAAKKYTVIRQSSEKCLPLHQPQPQLKKQSRQKSDNQLDYQVKIKAKQDKIAKISDLEDVEDIFFAHG